jgi:hypothetical protein
MTSPSMLEAKAARLMLGMAEAAAKVPLKLSARSGAIATRC